MITLNKKQIIGMVSMKEAIHAMESAFVHLSSGNARVPTRLKLNIPDKNATSLIMPAYAVGEPHYCVKIASVNYSNPHKGLPLIHSVVKVFDASKGNHVATFDGESITAIRTAAASGLATDLMAKKDAVTCAIFGTGVQAASHIRSITEVRNIKKLIIFSRNETTARKFCDSHSKIIKCEIGSQENLKEAEIILQSTTINKEFAIDHFISVWGLLRRFILRLNLIYRSQVRWNLFVPWSSCEKIPVNSCGQIICRCSRSY